MSKFKIYLIEQPSRYDNIDVFGISYGELIKHNLKGEFVLIDDTSEIVEQDIFALIYKNTPTITLEMLLQLKENIQKGRADGYRIGDGYIKKAGCKDKDMYQELPFKVTKVTNMRTLSDIIADMRYNILDKHLDNGVVINDPVNTHIDMAVTIGAGSVIHAMSVIRGNSKLGANVQVFPFCDINDSVIGDDSDIRASYTISAKVGKNTTIGPYACLRKGAIIGDNCRVGDFVEIKNSTLENDVKAAHLAYVGDSYVGENTNIGCGVVFANFDGKIKQSVIVGKDVFIGCNTNLVAPLEIEDGAYIAAGSTVTQNVPVNSLCIARARQVVKSEWDKPIETR